MPKNNFKPDHRTEEHFQLRFCTNDRQAYEKVMAVVIAVSSPVDLSNEVMHEMVHGATPQEALQEWDLI